MCTQTVFVAFLYISPTLGKQNSFFRRAPSDRNEAVAISASNILPLMSLFHKVAALKSAIDDISEEDLLEKTGEKTNTLHTQINLLLQEKSLAALSGVSVVPGAAAQDVRAKKLVTGVLLKTRQEFCEEECRAQRRQEGVLGLFDTERARYNFRQRIAVTAARLTPEERAETEKQFRLVNGAD
ncbi:MAG: uncharacterized protein A8A55_2415 [Amphiamblys sp. WSBS2006]|nr:MAG: uncharacterized protein A8A55_2415 [Amphiamblys sp. WSBS2006]